MFHAALLELPRTFEGTLVVADLHGHSAGLARYAELAESRRLFLVSLGDLVDRGPDAPGVLRRMRDLLERERGLFLRGNHDDKLFRTLLGRRTHIDEELAATLDQFHAAADGRELEAWFRTTYPQMPFVLGHGRTVMVHGALYPSMLPPVTVFTKRCQALALYGQTTGERTPEGRPVRIYRWLDELPADLLVIAGHDPLSGEVLHLRRGASGARLLHLDAGAGQGGPLAAAILDAEGMLRETLELRPGADAPRPCPVVPLPTAEAADAATEGAS